MTVSLGEPQLEVAPPLPSRVLILVTDPRLREEAAADLRGAGFAVIAPTAMDQAMILAEAFAPHIIVMGHPVNTSLRDVPFTAISRAGDRSTMVLVDSGDEHATISALNAGAD